MAYTIEDFLKVKSARGGSFSPDDTHIAYLSTSTGTAQIFLVSATGGKPKQLTDFQDSIYFVQFSPTKNLLIFGKSEGGNEHTQLYLLDINTLEIIDITNTPQVRHDFSGWSPDGKRICFSSNERNGKDFDVYVMDVNTREKRCVFNYGGWCIAQGFSPLGKYITIRKN